MNQKGDWCCFMPACGKDAWWPPVIPLVALLDAVDRKISVQQLTEGHISHPNINLGFAKSELAGSNFFPCVSLTFPGLFMSFFLKA